MNPEEENKSERAGKVTPLENIEGHNIQGRAAYGKQLKSSRGRGNLGERIGMDKKRDHVTPTKLPDFGEELEHDTKRISREVPEVYSPDEEAPKASENMEKEEEDPGNKMETMEGFIPIKSKSRITGQRKMYPKNIVKKQPPQIGANRNPIIAYTTPVVEHRSTAVPLKDSYLTAPIQSEPIFMTDPEEKILEKINITRESLGCQMCANIQDFATTITVCNKCRSSLKKEKKGRHICRWIEGIVFLILLGTIGTLIYFLVANDCERKSTYKDRDIQYAKHYLLEKQSQLANLSLALSTCLKREPILDNKLEVCEETIFQVKEDMTRTILQTTEVTLIYKEITEQINNWIKQGLVNEPTSGIGGFQDIVFVPSNMAIINQLKSYINDITTQVIAIQMNLNDYHDQKNQYIQNSIRIQALETQNLNLMKENENKLISIKSLKRKNINLNSKYMNLKMAYDINIQENKLDQIEKKQIIQKVQNVGQIQRYAKNSLMSTYNDNILTNKNRISSLIQNEEYSAYIIEVLLRNNNTYQLTNIKVLKAESENQDEILTNTQTNLYNIYNSLSYICYSTNSFRSICEYQKQLLINPNHQFFTMTYIDGIFLWEYDEGAEVYNSKQMMIYAQSGEYKRGEINEEGIYVVAGCGSNNIKIYDMKYYNYPDKKIELLNTFSHSATVFECFFKNSVSAICCDMGGYIKEYDLSNPHSIPTPTIFNKTALSGLYSCMQTKDKKYIIAGANKKLYILDAEDGTVAHTLDYSFNVGSAAHQIAEVRPNILVTADIFTVSLHDIRDMENIPNSVKLPDFGDYSSVIALHSNPGDFAVGGGYASNTNLGFMYIYHLEEDNQTIITLTYVDNISGSGCDIWVIKELKRGNIIFGGNSNCVQMCLWNYAAFPGQDPLCWDVQTGSWIEDIVGVPY